MKYSQIYESGVGIWDIVGSWFQEIPEITVQILEDSDCAIRLLLRLSHELDTLGLVEGEGFVVVADDDGDEAYRLLHRVDYQSDA